MRSPWMMGYASHGLESTAEEYRWQKRSPREHRSRPAMNASRQMAKLIKNLRDISGEPRLDLRELGSKLIDKSLKADGPYAARAAIVSLWNCIGLWHANHGVLAILDGEAQTGWRQLDRAFTYRWWMIRICDGTMTSASEAAVGLANAIVFEESDKADLLA